MLVDIKPVFTRRGRLPRQKLRRMPDRRFQHTLDYCCVPAVRYDRKKIAQYGLNIEDINLLLKTAFAGSAAGVVYDEEKRFDLVVRFDKNFRNDIEFIKSLYVPLPDGDQITLDKLAHVEIKSGTAQVSRENTKRRITIQFNVRNRDVQSIIEEIRNKLDSKLKLPPGYFITYGGQFENLVAAKERLSIAVPVVLLLIFLLLFFAFRSASRKSDHTIPPKTR